MPLRGRNLDSMSDTFGTSLFNRVAQFASLVSPRWGDEEGVDLTRGSAALHPWLACLAPLGRNRPWGEIDLGAKSNLGRNRPWGEIDR
jgi:hypothetical protein